MSNFIEPGRLLDDAYLLGESFAGGGYALVYEGSRVEDGVPVAVKVLRPDVSKNDKDASIRFAREAVILTDLVHPNIIRTFSAGETEDGFLYIVMERLKGEPLSGEIFKKPMEVPFITQVLVQILEGLIAAHAQGIVHRDLKPENIFLAEEASGVIFGTGDARVVKLLDFGFAQVIDSVYPGMATRLTAAGHCVGTPGYVPPEVIEIDEITPLFDLYAVGVVGYEMLTGAQAFPGRGVERLRAQIQGEVCEASAEIKQHPIYPVVRRLMMPDPSDRYASAEEALKALHALGYGKKEKPKSFFRWLLSFGPWG